MGTSPRLLWFYAWGEIKNAFYVVDLLEICDCVPDDSDVTGMSLGISNQPMKN